MNSLGWAVGLVLPVASLSAQSLPKADIAWTAEHLPESVQDSRMLTLPWPGHELRAGEWQRTASLGWQSVGSDLADASGLLAGVGATWAKSETFGWGGFAFYDRVRIAGDGSRELLRSSFSREVPLSLPAFAELTDPRGEVRHWGAGAQAVWQARKPGTMWRRTIVAGVYLEELEVIGFRMRYEVATGADAGARGELDWSASYTFATPFAGVGWTRPLGRSWAMTPRIVAGQPLPRQSVAGSIRGPGFSISGEGRGAAMGDGYVGAGLAFEHMASGIGIDVGSSLWYGATEGLTHEGLSRSLLVHLTWSR